jgi:DNA polymerase/3'-5' exonuclease PolX
VSRIADSEAREARASALNESYPVSLKKDLDPASALEIAEDFLQKTKDLYAKAEIAGSLRRKEPIVHDIDIAVIPASDNLAAWKEEVSKRVEAIGGSSKVFGDTMSDFLYRGIQVNLFLCPSEDSWGVTLMWATGPKGHTIGMTLKAQKKHLLYNSQGIWKREEPRRLIPTRTEMDVARVLDWKYKPPELRGKGETRC